MMNQPKTTDWPLEKVTTRRLHFGYQRKVGDPYLAVPIPDVLVYVDKAFDQLDNGLSLREVADWLNTSLNGIYDRTITYGGLRLLYKEYRPDSPRNNIKKKPKPRLSPEEILEKKRRKELRIAKRKATVAQKNIISLTTEVEEIGKEIERKASIPDNLVEHPASKQTDEDVIFEPNPGPQWDFLASEEMEVLYGGAAGGGKSYALLADPLRYFSNKNFNGLILRRTNDELRELIWKSHDLYPKVYPGAIWREKDKEWRFPSGARLWLTYLERDDDVRRYQGQAFTYIAFDELTQYPTPFPWEYLRSRLRTTDPTLPVYMRATTNPGGPGHGWVKRMFIDPAPPGTPFWATDISTGETIRFPEGHAKAGTPLFKRKFIQARLSDNPYLAADGNYELNLISLPEQQRRQLLEGDWHVADGAAFSEFRYDIHVTKPFEIPKDWKRFRSADFGYSSFSAVHWFAIDPTYETLIVYRELYVSKMTGQDLAEKILKLERGERILYGVLDSSVWAQRGQNGPSIAEEMIQAGVRWRPSDRTAGSRIAGKNRLHELLKPIEYGDNKFVRPGIIFFDTCRQIISDLPIIPMDPKGGEDIDNKYASDHAYDSIRYGIMSRPRSFSPFEMHSQSKPLYSYRPSDNVFGY